MNVTYTDKVMQSGEYYELVKRATTQLEEVLGQSANVVDARWDRTEDPKNRTLFVLRLEDAWGVVNGNFAPDELSSTHQVYFRLYRLWGDLIRAETNTHLAAMAGD